MTAAHPSSRRRSAVPNRATGDRAAAPAPAMLTRSPTTPPYLLSIMWQHCPAADRAAPPSFASRFVGHEVRPAGSARSFSRWTLRDWGMERLVDSVAVVSSELVTNALRYGLPDRPAEFTAPDRVWMGLLRQGTTVLCAVFDPGSDPPVVRVPDYLAESGRGLYVVASLSDSWGWTAPDRTGKTVWAVVSSPEGV